MKKEKIEELFYKHTEDIVIMDLEQFTKAINQAELEWYKKLEDRLLRMNCYVYRVISERLDEYIFEIQNKIKELEK